MVPRRHTTVTTPPPSHLYYDQNSVTDNDDNFGCNVSSNDGNLPLQWVWARWHQDAHRKSFFTLLFFFVTNSFLFQWQWPPALMPISPHYLDSRLPSLPLPMPHPSELWKGLKQCFIIWALLDVCFFFVKDLELIFIFCFILGFISFHLTTTMTVVPP